MITDPEWDIIAKKAFPKTSVKTPAFLWTRILARIEAEESRQQSSWWMQWRWMSRLTATVGLLVGLAAFYTFKQNLIPTDETTVQLASLDTDLSEADLLPGADS